MALLQTLLNLAMLDLVLIRPKVQNKNRNTLEQNQLCPQALLNLAEMNVGLSVFFPLTNYFHLDASFATNF